MASIERANPQPRCPFGKFWFRSVANARNQAIAVANNRRIGHPSIQTHHRSHNCKTGESLGWKNERNSERSNFVTFTLPGAETSKRDGNDALVDRNNLSRIAMGCSGSRSVAVVDATEAPQSERSPRDQNTASNAATTGEEPAKVEEVENDAQPKEERCEDGVPAKVKEKSETETGKEATEEEAERTPKPPENEPPRKVNRKRASADTVSNGNPGSAPNSHPRRISLQSLAQPVNQQTLQPRDSFMEEVAQKLEEGQWYGSHEKERAR